MTTPPEKNRRQLVFLLLILIIVRRFFPIFDHHSRNTLDSLLAVFASVESTKKEYSGNAMFSEFSLCMVMVSCNRSNSLRSGLWKLFECIGQANSNLSYEMIWIGQAIIDRISLGRVGTFDKKFLFARPVGYSMAFHLAFSQCSFKYMFIMEHNWLTVNISSSWLSFAMDLLAHAPESMYAFLLRTIGINGPIYRATVQSSLMPSGTVWRLGRRSVPLADGPVVYRMSSLRGILATYEYTNVVEFAERARVLGYTASFWAEGKDSPHEVPVSFGRIGTHFTRYKPVSMCKGESSD
jgi:hypothetical protein